VELCDSDICNEVDIVLLGLGLGDSDCDSDGDGDHEGLDERVGERDFQVAESICEIERLNERLLEALQLT
jgi:hypothetical protein